jgi:hypothetical protein
MTDLAPIPTTPPELSTEEKIDKIMTDVAQLLEVFLKLFEQFNHLKDSPMLSAFFSAPRKK